MDKRDFNRVFDQVRPSRSQKETMLRRLLEPEKEEFSVKKLKKLTVIAIAAALMIVTCAAAVVTGLDQRLLDYFGASPEQAQLLVPGAMPVDVTVEDNGAALHVTQVLMDRYTVLALADFTAPEGTVLDMDEDQEGIDRGFGGMEQSMPQLLDQAGEPIELNQSWAWKTEVLPDGDPLDNHLTLLLRIELSEGIQPDWNISGLALNGKDLVRFDLDRMEYVTVYSGDWSCQFPITWQDMGRSIQPDQVAGQLDSADITVKQLYLSPMTLQIQLERSVPVKLEIQSQTDGMVYSRWVSAVNTERMSLTTKDGRTIPLTELGGTSSDRDLDAAFQLDEITSLEDLQGGTLTLRIGEGSVDIPLDGLTPAE
ncbi:DUF4179 domain-containing protein [Pseudoflavonifractor sp. 60]|uniref:DUF4179 domain-containing protein n=1 Tax=Pseudoflavonifractor sp. 60 TaxID=2304576 RepID=UPI00136DA97A|nr:DUF4179 domain-containing protein [Pseudoflavonifractor sp. 60]NBI65861.1 DUF4179 domain-containing protein [Pseudoflavonifractor sp. 60]